MGAQDNQYSDLSNSIANQALQSVANYCSITCNDNISNLDIVIEGGDDTINIQQSCSIMGAECLVKTIMSSQIDNLVKNIVSQEQSPRSIFSLLGPSSNESSNITNSIKNQVSQLISNTCAISASNSISNTAVFAQDANLNFTIGQNASVNNAECVLDTTAKLLINNDITNSVKQSESGLTLGSFIAIIVLVVIILILIILGPAIFEGSLLVGKVIGG
jgi:hypothetical protein